MLVKWKNKQGHIRITEITSAKPIGNTGISMKCDNGHLVVTGLSHDTQMELIDNIFAGQNLVLTTYYVKHKKPKRKKSFIEKLLS